MIKVSPLESSSSRLKPILPNDEGAYVSNRELSMMVIRITYWGYKRGGSLSTEALFRDAIVRESVQKKCPWAGYCA
jgi:hypothetical protein